MYKTHYKFFEHINFHFTYQYLLTYCKFQAML